MAEMSLYLTLFAKALIFVISLKYVIPIALILETWDILGK